MHCDVILINGAQDYRTPDERWYTERNADNAPYNMGADFALESLGAGAGRCLVIGSPLFEAQELRAAGWDVTYLDVRQPPVEIGWIPGDATRMPFPDAHFDAVSTNCVLCHAGLGRYGDRLDEQGDERMLAEIHRVLKPGALAVVGFGPAVDNAMPILFAGNQRMYTLTEARAMARRARFGIVETRVLDHLTEAWRAPGAHPAVLDMEAQPVDIGRVDYLSMLLRRI